MVCTEHLDYGCFAYYCVMHMYLIQVCSFCQKYKLSFSCLNLFIVIIWIQIDAGIFFHSHFDLKKKEDINHFIISTTSFLLKFIFLNRI